MAACQGITTAYCMDTSATTVSQEAMMDHAMDLCSDKLTQTSLQWTKFFMLSMFKLGFKDHYKLHLKIYLTLK